jgi:hypothetical protein
MIEERDDKDWSSGVHLSELVREGEQLCSSNSEQNLESSADYENQVDVSQNKFGRRSVRRFYFHEPCKRA